jgi:hypothetical protein
MAKFIKGKQLYNEKNMEKIIHLTVVDIPKVSDHCQLEFWSGQIKRQYVDYSVGETAAPAIVSGFKPLSLFFMAMK